MSSSAEREARYVMYERSICGGGGGAVRKWTFLAALQRKALEECRKKEKEMRKDGSFEIWLKAGSHCIQTVRGDSP